MRQEAEGPLLAGLPREAEAYLLCSGEEWSGKWRT